MAILHFNPVVFTTFQRLYGVTPFLEAIDSAIPIVECREHEYLVRLASQEGWDYGDFQVEKAELNAKFWMWTPRLASYSVIIHLHSIVECQLMAGPVDGNSPNISARAASSSSASGTFLAKAWDRPPRTWKVRETLED